MKFTLFSILIIVLLGIGGYFAIKNFTDPKSYVVDSKETLGDLHPLTTDPDTASSATTPPVATSSTTSPSVTLGSKTAVPTLQVSIQNMLTAKTVLKLGSKGVTVGYLQQFMNAYFNKNLKIDNNFGKTLQTDVLAFQKATGVSQTGQVGQATLQKMIDWLSQNPQ